MCSKDQRLFVQFLIMRWRPTRSMLPRACVFLRADLDMSHSRISALSPISSAGQSCVLWVVVCRQQGDMKALQQAQVDRRHIDLEHRRATSFSPSASPSHGSRTTACLVEQYNYDLEAMLGISLSYFPCSSMPACHERRRRLKPLKGVAQWAPSALLCIFDNGS